MSRVVQIQTNFTTGELDPKLRARIDLQQYYNGLQTATNISIQPQGGFTRRDGSKYITSLPAGAANGVKMVPFEFSVDDSYMLIFVDQRMYVFKDGALITAINGGANDYLTVTKVTAARLELLNFTQAADTLILVHPLMEPQKIVRGATDADWTISDLALDFVPKFAYSIAFVNPQDDLDPDVESGNITFTSGYTAVTGTAQAGAATTITLAAGASAVDDFYNNLYIVTTGGTGSGQTRLITDYVGSTKVATVDTAWTVTPDATTTYSIQSVSSLMVNQYVNISPQGRVRIVEYVDANTVKGIAEVPLFDDTAIAEGNWEVEYGYEDTWSASRGWPRSAVFHEGRLFFGGSSSRPSTLWGSRVSDFFNFDPGELLDDAALEATLDTGKFNAITNLYSGRNLQVFTTGGEFYIPQSLGDPITPSTLAVKEQTSNGSRPGIPVVNVDGATVFIQRQGKAIAEFLFSDAVAGYVSNKISLLASHLLRSPSDMAVRKATSTDEGDRLFIVNSDDGSLACFTLLRSEQVVAPAEWTTSGEYLAIGVDISDIYTVVKRTINSATVYYVEIFDKDVTLDCAKSATVGSSTASVTGLSFLEGETVKVIRDGIVEDDKTVASGTITFTIAAEEDYQVGLNFTPEAKTMPVEPRLQSGSLRGFKKRILEVNAELFETKALTINGQKVEFRQFGTNNLNIPIQSFTGLKRAGPLLGFDQEGSITITQIVPLPMNVLALDYKVSVGQ
jgi:hypothetical protein